MKIIERLSDIVYIIVFAGIYTNPETDGWLLIFSFIAILLIAVRFAIEWDKKGF